MMNNSDNAGGASTRPYRSLAERSEALVLSGLGPGLLMAPLFGDDQRSDTGLSWRGRCILGPANRSIAFSVRELFGPASRAEADCPEFELAFHGVMLQGARGPVALRRLQQADLGLPVWCGTQPLLDWSLVFHLLHLEVVLPGHGWAVTMQITPGAAA